MSKLEKKKMMEIEDRVQRIFSNSSLDDAIPVDIVGIVKQDGFEVKPIEMQIDTTGCLLVDDSPSKPMRVIIVNTIFKNSDNDTDVVFKKSRFITAHEYGHYILHKSSEQTLYAHRDSDKRDEPQELEADYFARCLVMPYNRFKAAYHMVKEISSDDRAVVVEVLSQLFAATKNKIIKRIEDLAILEG